MEVDILNIPKLRFKEFTDEWQIKKLDKNTYIKARVGWKNLKASEYVSSGIPMIAGQHIKQGKILWDKVDFITNERYDESPEIQLKNNDIIFSKDGSLGNPAIIKNMPKKATINGTMMLIRLNYINDNVSPNYFYQICNSQYFKKMVSLIKSGGTVPHIFQRDIINFTFPIPKTLEEQEKIANFLSIVDKKVENLKNTITSLENQKKGLLQQIFSQKLRFKDKNGNNYLNWEKKKLGQYINYKKGYAFKSELYTNKGIRIIRVSDLSATSIKNDSPIYISQSLYTNYLDWKLYTNDIIITTVGSKPPIYDSMVGKVILFPDNLPYKCFLNQNAVIIRACTQVNQKFLYYTLSLNKYINHIKNILRGNANQANITLVDLFEYKIPLPCLEEQTKIADFLSAFDRKLDNQKAQLEHWQQIKKGLLQQMFV